MASRGGNARSKSRFGASGFRDGKGKGKGNGRWKQGGGKTNYQRQMRGRVEGGRSSGRSVQSSRFKIERRDKANKLDAVMGFPRVRAACACVGASPMRWVSRRVCGAARFRQGAHRLHRQHAAHHHHDRRQRRACSARPVHASAGRRNVQGNHHPRAVLLPRNQATPAEGGVHVFGAPV